MSIAIVGLTGQTGAGKSWVGDFLRSKGYAVIDCDQVARRVTSPDTDCLRALAEAFSSAILHPDGSLNRQALGKIVFSNGEQLQQLNKLIFPFITEEIRLQVTLLEGQGHSLVVLDAPTLFESGVDRLCEGIISVTACEAVRLSRIRERDHLSQKDALHRMHSQLGEEYFRTHSDLVIENNGSLGELQAQLAQADSLLQGIISSECG